MASHSKSIAMTNKEILQADLLDILFEHRNKLYGAYALRKSYTHRLGLALGVALSTVLLFVFMTFIKKDNGSNGPFKDSNAIVITDVNLEEKIKEPERARNEPKPQVAQADHQQIIVAPDNEADEIPDQETISNSEVSNVNTEGMPSDDLAKTKTQSEGNDVIQEKQPEEIEKPVLPNRNASFPGGTAAWLEFLRRFLQAPEDLDPGQRIEVMVRFQIDADGRISSPEIIKSGGKSFDKEVLRVLKKMSPWEPAIQNGNYVAVAYTQPVIFLGVEE